jgi:hypothetical protein
VPLSAAATVLKHADCDASLYCLAGLLLLCWLVVAVLATVIIIIAYKKGTSRVWPGLRLCSASCVVLPLRSLIRIARLGQHGSSGRKPQSWPNH